MWRSWTPVEATWVLHKQVVDQYTAREDWDGLRKYARVADDRELLAQIDRHVLGNTAQPLVRGGGRG